LDVAGGGTTAGGVLAGMLAAYVTELDMKLV